MTTTTAPPVSVERVKDLVALAGDGEINREDANDLLTILTWVTGPDADRQAVAAIHAVLTTEGR